MLFSSIMSKKVSWKFSVKTILLSCSFFLFVAAGAQVTTSPYSRYGLGDFQFTGFVQGIGMGGGGIGMRNDSLLVQYINMNNPASLTSNNIVAYEVGLQSNTSLLRNDTASAVLNRSTLSHIGLAFPIAKWWSGAIGLVPYSSVGYNVSNSEVRDTIGNITYKYEGSGGISQVFTSHAFRPFSGLPAYYKNTSRYDQLVTSRDTVKLKKAIALRNGLSNISVGATVSYLFGPLNNVRRDIFPDSSYSLNTRITRTTTIRDVYASYGAQYRFRLPIVNPKYKTLKKDTTGLLCDKSIGDNYFCFRKTPGGVCSDTSKLFIKSPQGAQVSFGAVFALPVSVRATTDLYAQTYKLNAGFETFIDTVYNQSDASGNIVLPAMFGFGFAVKKDFRWQFQADYAQQMWENFTFLGETTDLKNSERMTAGVQWQPKVNYRRNYFANVQYRFGARYYKTYLELKGTQLREYGITAGFGFPVRELGRINLGLEAGRRGTTESNLIEENYFRVMFTVSVNDRWFQRLRYD
ncbi:MAG: hypothetical protein FD123_2675 [Bacteroidetes bacterium]|nr:MAG: hypothetical protein FD123_2675 [Bacteroidota bacterium]